MPEGKFERVLGPVGELEVYRNNDFAPRAWWAPGNADLGNLELPDQPRGAQVTHYAPTAIDVQVDAPDAGYLVLSETSYPGWSATVNGQAAPVEQVNGALRAVPVPAGAAKVSLRYWPASWTWGLIMAAAGFVFVVMALFLRPRKSRPGLMRDHLLAIDNGTQSVRALVFDLAGNLVAKAQVTIEPYFSRQPGWAEQNPDYYWSSLCAACRQLWEKAPELKQTIAGVALTTQRATVINVDRKGRPLRPAIRVARSAAHGRAAPARRAVGAGVQAVAHDRDHRLHSGRGGGKLASHA